MRGGPSAEGGDLCVPRFSGGLCTLCRVPRSGQRSFLRSGLPRFLTDSYEPKLNTAAGRCVDKTVGRRAPGKAGCAGEGEPHADAHLQNAPRLSPVPWSRDTSRHSRVDTAERGRLREAVGCAQPSAPAPPHRPRLEAGGSRHRNKETKIKTVAFCSEVGHSGVLPPGWEGAVA